MPIVNITFTFPTVNVSAQVGDIAYYSHSGTVTGGFNNTALPNTTMLGPIISIIGNAVTVQYDNVLSNPLPGDYISFAKDKKINTSSLLGYFASVNFVNDSTEKAELYSVGSEVVESSK
tara:strand:- start:1433 stop:1789 length:357 start_codon:yes stop_codon:yes gene_type:complete